MLSDILKVGRFALGGIVGLKKIARGAGIAAGGAAVVGALVGAGILPADTPAPVVAVLTAAASAGINGLKVYLLKFNIHIEVEKAE